MQDIVAALSGLGDKMERLAEMTRTLQLTSTSTASAVEVKKK